jgi:hypothetical protein
MANTPHDHGPHKAAYDDLSVRSIALVGAVGSVLVFVAVIAVQVVYFRYEQAEFGRKVLDVPTTKVNAVLDAQRHKLSVAGEGANPERRERSIPVEQAMRLIVAEYREKQSAAGEDKPVAQDQPAANENSDNNAAATGNETPEQ